MNKALCVCERIIQAFDDRAIKSGLTRIGLETQNQWFQNRMFTGVKGRIGHTRNRNQW